MGKSFDPMGWACAGVGREAHASTPRPIVSMSFQLAVPWRVTLPQSPPPLHQPGAIMQQSAAAGQQKPANGQLCLNYLSHPRGQAHTRSPFVNYLKAQIGCVATFKKRQESDWSGRPGAVSCRHPEQLVDELNLSPNIRTAHPPRLPLPDHVYCLVSLDRSPCRVEFTKALLGLHSSFDR